MTKAKPQYGGVKPNIRFAAQRLAAFSALLGLSIAAVAPAVALDVQPRLSTGASAMTQCSPSERRYLRLPEELERLWGLSQAVQVGSTIHFAGFLALDEQGNIEGTSLEAQTAAIYRHIDHALTYFGATRREIVDETVFVRSMDSVNEGGLMPRNAFFATISPPPPMTLIGVTELAHPQAVVEVKINVQLDCSSGR
jgi:2-iminobutanoate/2-iminopropanoate deaminase